MQPNDVKFQTKTIRSATEFIVWNKKGLRHQVAKIKGWESLRLLQTHSFLELDNLKCMFSLKLVKETLGVRKSARVGIRIILRCGYGLSQNED